MTALGRKKILYISHSAQLAGAELCLLNLVRNLDRERFTSAVVFPEEGPLKESIEGLGITTYLAPLEWGVWASGRLKYNAVPLPERVQRILEIIDKEEPQIIHSNTSVIFEGAIAAKLKGIPHVWHIHEVLEGHPSLQAFLPLPLFYRVLEFLSDKVVVVSNDMKRELAAFVASEKLQTVFNGIDPARYKDVSAANVRGEFGIPDDCLLSINVATISRYKGQDNLLEAAALAKAKGSNVKYLLVGPGSKENVDALLSKIKDLNLTEDVFYLGYREDAPELIKGSDFFVLPSVKEGFPLAVLEAMALGKPVIATDCCGPADMVNDGVNGYLVPVGRPDLLGDKILQLSRDKSAMANMGEQSYEKYRANFGIEKYASDFEKLYGYISEAIPSAGGHFNSTDVMELLFEAYQRHVDSMQKTVDLERKLLEYSRLVADRDRQLDEKNRLIEDRNRQIEDKNRSLSERDTAIVALQAETVEREARIESLNCRIDGLLNSLSWKLTGPIRAILDKIAGKGR
jgi:glycosyltransferase involved in cell wall biosynthesis